MGREGGLRCPPCRVESEAAAALAAAVVEAAAATVETAALVGEAAAAEEEEGEAAAAAKGSRPSSWTCPGKEVSSRDELTAVT